MGHTRANSQCRPHTHAHGTRNQPAIGSVLTTTTNRPRNNHDCFFTACNAAFGAATGIGPDKFREDYDEADYMRGCTSGLKEAEGE